MSVFNTFMPNVIEHTPKGERVWDIPSRLFKDRIIVLSGEINREVATVICSQILVLQHENPEKEIQMIINSPGGETTAGFAIYDMMQITSCPIRTTCVGDACSFGAILLVGGTKDRRCILPNSRVLLHQPWGGLKGQVTDMEIHLKDALRTKEKCIEVFKNHSKISEDVLRKEMERDYILYAEEAVEAGIVDEILIKQI